MIDVRRLRALAAVHRTGSVSAAAAELRYGQPTLSHHLRRLEAETQSVLLQRVGRGVRLTPDGVRLAKRAEEILGLLTRASDELAARTSLRAGCVRLAAFPSATATMVPEVLTDAADRAPGLRLDIIEAEPPEAVALLRRGAADLALTFSYPGQSGDHEDVRFEPIVEDPLMLVLPADEPDGPDAGSLARYADRRWVTGCERCRGELLALCHATGFEPSIGFASDDYVAVQALVAAGFGVSVLPGLALQAHRDPRVRAERLPVARTVELTSYGRPPRPAAIEAVAESVREVAAAISGTIERPIHERVETPSG